MMGACAAGDMTFLEGICQTCVEMILRTNVSDVHSNGITLQVLKHQRSSFLPSSPKEHACAGLISLLLETCSKKFW